jgi:hypothetical protein
MRNAPRTPPHTFPSVTTEADAGDIGESTRVSARANTTVRILLTLVIVDSFAGEQIDD